MRDSSDLIQVLHNLDSVEKDTILVTFDVESQLSSGHRLGDNGILQSKMEESFWVTVDQKCWMGEHNQSAWK